MTSPPRPIEFSTSKNLKIQFGQQEQAPTTAFEHCGNLQILQPAFSQVELFLWVHGPGIGDFRDRKTYIGFRWHIVQLFFEFIKIERFRGIYK